MYEPIVAAEIGTVDDDFVLEALHVLVRTVDQVERRHRLVAATREITEVEEERPVFRERLMYAPERHAGPASENRSRRWKLVADSFD